MKYVYKFVSVAIVMPIWFFLMYTLLAAAKVDRLVWFLFWIYIPLSICIAVVEKLTMKEAA